MITSKKGNVRLPKNLSTKQKFLNLKTIRLGGLIGVFLVFSAFFTVIGCKKDNSSSSTNKDVTFLKSTETKESIMAIHYDDEDLKIREVKWSFGEALRDVYKANPNFLKIVLEDAKNSRKKEAEILRICNQYPEIKSALAKSLSNNTKSSLTDDQIINSYIIKMVNKGYSYTGVIKIPNYSTMDPTLYPIVSNGLDVSENSGLDDGIFAYNFTDEKNYEEVLIDEKMALETKKPILIFQNGITDEEYNNPKEIKPMIIDDSNIDKYINGEVSEEDKKQLKASSSFKKFDYLHITLKGSGFHYDGCCNNNVVLRSYYWLGANQSQSWGWNYNANAWKQIIGLSSGQCNNVNFTQWGELFYPGSRSPAPHSSLAFYYNPYERDWYASWKSIGQFSYQGKTLFIDIDASYTHERYGQNMGNWGIGWPTEGVLIADANTMNMWRYVDIQSTKMKLAFTRTQ